MGEKDTAGQAGDTREKQNLPDQNGSNPQIDQFDFLHSVSASAHIGCDKRKQSSEKKTAVGVFVGIVVSGVIGLAIGFFVLYLLFPKHPFVEGLAKIFDSSAQAPLQKPSVSQGIDRQQKSQKYESVSSNSQTPKREDYEPSSSHLKTSPTIDDGPAISTPAPKADSNENNPQQPRNFVQIPDAPKAAKPPSSQEIRRVITLDLSKSISRAMFAEAADGDEAQVRVEDVTGLDTPWEMRPLDGVVRKGHPVDIVLKDYPDIRIRLSLSAKSVAVEATPQVDIGQSKKIPLTQQRIKQYLLFLNKELAKVSQPLSEAKTTAQNIEAWLKDPGSKPKQLKETRQQQLNVLKNQIIPPLDQKATDAQARVDTMQRISQLVEQIHGTAGIHLIMQKEIKDVEERKEDTTNSGDASNSGIPGTAGWH